MASSSRCITRLTPTTAPIPLAAYGSVGLEAPEGNVIPYADLTPEIVIGWVQEKLGGEEKVAEISKRRSRNRLMSSAHPPPLLACRGLPSWLA
jgi:hypothetical protein